MNYRIRQISGQEPFEVFLVVLDNGTNFTFWKKESSLVVNNAIVVFNNKQANIQLDNEMAILSLSGVNNLEEIYQAVRIFMININNQDIDVKFKFIVENVEQWDFVEEVGNRLNISYEVINVNGLERKNVSNLEEKLKNDQDYSASGSKTIEVEKDTEVEKVTISDDKAYVNSGVLSIEEEKYSLLQKWKNDPYMSQKLMDMSEEEIDRMLMDSVTTNLTTHRMESADEQLGMSRVGEAALDVASKEGGLVNAELGIVENDISKSNQYSTVEERGDRIQVVEPTVTSSKITSSGVDSHISNSDEDMVKFNFSFDEDEVQTRDVSNEVFYIDELGSIYTNDGEVIGKLGSDGYRMNYVDNSLIKSDRVIGFIGDYKDMGKTFSNTNAKKRVLEKDDNKSSGFINFPVIMFILSALLLIGALVLLFVLD